MRICVDLDGVVAQLRGKDQSYADVQPVPGAREKLKALKEAGHYIIVATARHMSTCSSNQGLVMAKIGQLTLEWLQKHQIEYDEIWFGKPHCDVYLDDNGLRFSNWDSIDSDGGNLPRSHENELKRSC